MRRRVTITDVSAAAGVSAATVSRVLNGTAKVDPALAERVLATVRDLGYRPNAAAQGLARGESGTIGVLMPDLANPYFPDVLKAISAVARANDRRVMVMESDEDPDIEHAIVDDLMRSCDGILLCSPRMDRAELVDLVDRNLPMVLVNRIAPGLDVPSITVDFFGGMTLICGHLAQLGHRRVAYLAGPAKSWANTERIRAFPAAKAFGLDVTVIPCGATSRAGYDKAPEVLDTDATALVTYNDLIARGAITRLAELGVAVPQDLSVIGFDDIMLDQFATSTISTVAVSRERLGREAAEMLRARMSGSLDSEPRYLTVELRQRGTSAAPRPASTGVAR